MSKIGNATKKILAAVLTMLLVFGMVPVSAIPVSAATTDYPEAVTVTVKDGGNPISGAEVSFTITDSTDTEVKKGTVTTNANGSAEVLAKADYKEGLTIKGTVTKAGYDSAVINEAITSDDKDIIVTIKTKKITGVTVTKVSRTVEVNEALELVAGDAVIIAGLKEDDTVSYQINGKNSDTMPKISKVGIYNVTVVIKRAGYEDLIETVTSEITEKKVNVDAEAITGLTYTGEAQELVKINNAEELKNKYGVTLDVKNNSATEVGVYNVTISGKSSVEGIVVEEKTVEGRIDPVQITRDMVTLKIYNEKYDGAEHPAVTTVELKNGIEANITYKVAGGDWTEKCPIVKDVGETYVYIKVSPVDSKNYKGEVFYCKAVVSKSENREFKFDIDTYNTTATSKSNAEVVAKDGETITIDKSYNFGAKAAEQTKDETVKYKVEKIGTDGKATINEKGLLTVTEPGTFRVTATIAENNNYTKAEISHEINVRAVPKDKEGNRVPFIDFGEITEKDYYVNKNNLVISDVEAKLTVKDSDNSNVTYKIFPVDSNKLFSGIACDATTGKVYITNIDTFIAYLNRAGGNLQVKVEATKSEGALTIGDKDSYIINIQYPYVNENLFTLAMSLTGTGWINSEVTVNPVAGYKIAKARKYGQDTTIISHEKIEAENDAAQIKAALNNAFTSKVKFGDDGQNQRSVYLCDAEGYIYAPIDVKVNFNGVMQDLKIDRTNPDAGSMKISYSTEKNSIVDKIKTLFYKDTVTLTLEATDKLSGIQRFTCEYNGKEIPVENFESTDGKSAKATATITIEEGKEYKSKVSFKAYDRAGNVTKKTGDETVIIDYVSPEMTVEYVNPVNVVPDSETTPKTYYFNETTPLVYKVKVKETNGFEENGKITVLKDGKAFDGATVKYERLGGYDVYTVTVLSTKENQGVYTVEASYTDKSTNIVKAEGEEITTFVSNEMVIDTTKPEIELVYEHKGGPNYTIDVFVTEVNFDAADMAVVIEAKDINGDDIIVDKLNNYIKNPDSWEIVEGNKRRCQLSYGANGVLPDALYKLTFSYIDLAKHSVTGDTTDIGIDTVAPTAPKIGYEKPITQVVFDAVTFGFAENVLYKFFKAPAKITLSSSDEITGVQKFVLEYNSEDPECKSHKDKIIIDNIKPIPDKNSKHIFEATVNLPESLSLAEFDQLRGSMKAYAVDNHGNVSETVTDDRTVVVVDNIVPEVSVEYEASKVPSVGNKTYYNEAIDTIITVEEANFDPTDVKLVVEKDGVDIGFNPSDIKWDNAKDENKKVIPDTYTGEFTLPAPEDHSADGDYVVKVTYTDKSTNKAADYESDILVIDTTAPVINVVYSNTAPNTFEDPYLKGVQRDYFSDEQVATITITEHNFDEGENAKDINISEKDIINNDLSGTYVASGWGEPDGDNHSMTIDYLGDANYSFDMGYTDLAGNSAVYGTDYFTVDKSAPTVKCEQINSVGTTILKNITFGTFKEKAEIKVVAEDDVSPIDLIDYSYTQTEGTSTANKETEKGKAEAKDLTYGGKTATYTFVMPKGALKKGNNMHGTVEFTATNRAGKKSTNAKNAPEVTTDIIVDNIAPNVTIAYSKAYTTENGISYYDGKITGTITVVEANFNNSEEFNLYYSKDGAKNKPIKKLKWTATENEDEYVATFTLTEDGDYIITADYKDVSTNAAEFNKTKVNKGTKYSYKSNQLTIDTKINAPVITFTGNSNGGLGFNDEVIPGVKFEDDNYKSYQITLTRTRYDEKNIDVKDKFIGNRVAINANGGSGSFNTFEKIRDNDGVYTLTVRMTDMVDHSSTTSRTFVVNRFGSVYVYNDALIDLIKDRYVQDVNDELVITEYNANKLKEDTLKVDISRDGRPVDDVIASTAPVKNNGWYEYAHTINRENFNAEGLYKIALSSTDEVNNDSQNKEAKNTLKNDFSEVKDVLWFKVDKTLPSITNISFKDEAKNKDSKYTEINAEGTEVEFTVYDAIGIAKVEVIVDGESTTYEGETLGDDINNFVGKITLAESKKQQEVIIKVTDLAGRVLDTSKKDEAKDSIPDSFTGSVLVSTNFFVRFWNDKPVFWGVVGGTLGAAALVIILVALKKRKKKDDK
ncbi:MAG: hypothetical protein E7530_03730 [Ruminococcaceae bacterium]|nr:hypothetical protein [Oscillospiraceae bacterium]